MTVLKNICSRCGHFIPHYVRRGQLFVRTDCGDCACHTYVTENYCDRFIPRDEQKEEVDRAQAAAVSLQQIAERLAQVAALLEENKSQ